MSGCTGAERVRSRADYEQFQTEVITLLEDYPNYRGATCSGSYASDPHKETFGDIDLIVTIDGDNKSQTKRDLVKWVLTKDCFVPFSSAKYAGRIYMNTGELVSVRYHSSVLGYSVQIDLIVSLSEEETKFKREFLNLPAEIQGLLIGLVRVAYKSNCLGYDYEYILSSSGVNLRRVKYDAKYNELEREEIKLSWYYDFDWIRELINPVEIAPFNDMLEQVDAHIDDKRKRQRIVGLFKSMVSVKTGEVGTEKGTRKLDAIHQIQQKLLGEVHV